MTILQQIQPNFPNGFGTQISISSQTFNLVLNTARTRQELERSWEALAQQEELIGQIRNARQQNYIYILLPIYITSCFCSCSFFSQYYVEIFIYGYVLRKC